MSLTVEVPEAPSSHQGRATVSRPQVMAVDTWPASPFSVFLTCPAPRATPSILTAKKAGGFTLEAGKLSHIAPMGLEAAQ